VPNYRAVLAYDGAPFRGLARQPDVPTVQGVIEDALGKILGSPVTLSVAGRTDAGVHALGQVISFSLPGDLPPGTAEDLDDLKRRLNSICGPAISILEISEAPEGFDARFSAVSRTYEYAVFTREEPDPFSRHTTWHHPGSLDAAAMRKAAGFFVGEHDFTAFGRVAAGQSPVRHLESLEVSEQHHLLLMTMTANSFVQQMVRSIVGTLVAAGEGKISPESIPDILGSRDRSAAAPVAPPHGLFLVSVSYPEELL
jgi:tRNA pseudouridine38-40 synthase